MNGQPDRLRFMQTESFSRRNLILLVVLFAVMAVGLWSYGQVKQSLRDLRAEGLSTLADTQIEALEVWIGELRHDVAQLAADPELSHEIDALAATARDAASPGMRLRATRTHDILDRRMNSALTDSGAAAFRVVDADGRVIASNLGVRGVPERIRAALASVLQGRIVFVHPTLERAPAGQADAARMDQPMVWILAPVRNRAEEAIAVIGLGHPAQRRFAEILKTARPGRSGEAFAFDANGIMLSESRFVDDVRQRGLLPAGSVSTILALKLRDGGTEEAVADAPLTALAVAALAGRFGSDPQQRHGLILEPYRSYLGRESIGAWRWLGDYDMAVAVEMGEEEAYAPLHYLAIGFAVLLGLATVVGFTVLLPPAALARVLRGSGGGMRRLGPYRIAQQIGEGAISNVYLARHNLLKRAVAIKVLKKQSTTDEWTARFEREVQISSELSHPNTIVIYDYGRTPGGVFYYAMEYLEGLSLSDLVERYGPVPGARAAWLLKQVCASLGEAHAKGIIHRDIKPQNIMTCVISGVRDVVKVLDFGLVKRIDATDTRDLTSSLRMLGTPLYMAPERITHPTTADARTDIYSLGAVGFFLLTGKRLFETETDHDLTYQILHTVPRRCRDCAPHPVHAALDDLLARCLAKDPAERPASVEEVAAILQNVLDEQPWTTRQIDAWWSQNWLDAAHPERRIVAM